MRIGAPSLADATSKRSGKDIQICFVGKSPNNRVCSRRECLRIPKEEDTLHVALLRRCMDKIDQDASIFCVAQVIAIGL